MSTMVTDTAQRWLTAPARAHERTALTARLLGPRFVPGTAGWLVSGGVLQGKLRRAAASITASDRTTGFCGHITSPAAM